MTDEIDTEEEDNGTTLAYIYGNEPDYREWPPPGKFSPLYDAVCYAIGLHLDPEERPDSESPKEATHSAILNHAISDILSDRLIAEDVNGEHWVQVLDFYRWLNEQGQEFYSDLHPEFIARDPSLSNNQATSSTHADTSNKMPWVAEAKKIAEEIDRLHPDWSQVDISKDVHEEMIKKNITGRGRRVPAPGTIRKEAMVGIVIR